MSKVKTKYRIRFQSGGFGKLDFNFGDKGAIISTDNEKEAFVFDTAGQANAAVQRTAQTKLTIEKSQFFDWVKFDPITKAGVMMIEPWIPPKGKI
jgi:hypothetical protein